MTRKAKKPARKRKKAIRQTAVEQKPTTVPRVPFMGAVPKPRGFWKRIWVSLFGA